MSALLGTLAFGLGIYLSIRTIAALYGVIDLWYTIGTAWPAVAGRVAFWGGGAGALAWLLAPPYRTGLVAGLSGYFLFYLSLYVFRRPALRALRSVAARETDLAPHGTGGPE